MPRVPLTTSLRATTCREALWQASVHSPLTPVDASPQVHTFDGVHPIPDTVRVGWLGSARPEDRTGPTLVVLHGYGANEQDLMSMLPVLGMLMPGVSAKILAVRGFYPVRHRGRDGFSWFPGTVDAQPSDDDIAEIADRIAALVTVHADRAVWLGFSQGMCAAITVLRRRPWLVDAVVALSGFSWPSPQPADAALAASARTQRAIPAFYGRDPADPAIPTFASAWALDFLRAHTRLTERSYLGIGHSLSLPEIGDVVDFIRPHLTR